MFTLKPTPSKGPLQSVEVFGCKKTATVVVHCKRGKGSSRHTGVPWRWWSHTRCSTSYRSPFCFWARSNLLVWISRSWARVKGGGFVAQIYVIPQSISKILVVYCQKYVGEASKKEIKDTLIQCDWPLLVTPVAVNPESSEVMVPVLNTRNPTDKPISRKIRVHPCN